jgi:hypothetical protein
MYMLDGQMQAIVEKTRQREPGGLHLLSLGPYLGVSQRGNCACPKLKSAVLGVHAASFTHANALPVQDEDGAAGAGR